MTSPHDLRRRTIWATRGRTWGFRFLLDAGLPDPLPTYEAAFADAGDGPTAFRQGAGRTALRFVDPTGRRDSAGRPVLHELVVLGDEVDTVASLEDGVALMWPVIETVYARVWDLDRTPTTDDLTSNP